jgi:hypothetical protein
MRYIIAAALIALAMPINAHMMTGNEWVAEPGRLPQFL